MSVRMAVVAGQFYESSYKGCLQQIEALLPRQPIELPLPEKILAGVVPHAGWVFSGDLAALVLSAIKQQQSVDTFVIFGAVHTSAARHGLLYDTGQWGTPLGTVDVDESLGAAILAEATSLIRADCPGHSREHSIEVQVPLIQYLFEKAAIVPILVPPVRSAHEIGRAVAQVIARSDKQIVCLASTDLTHYGPSYAFTPMGTSPDAIRWAKETNDQFFIDLALSMQADKLVESAQMYGSACGAGAVAAVVAAAAHLGAAGGQLLAHTTSAEVIDKKFHQLADDSVGYAALIFGK